MQSVPRSEPPTTPVTRPPRRHLRIAFSVPLTVHHLASGALQRSHGISLDLSEGGLGALVESQPSVGDAVEIDIQLPGNPLSAVAIVRHASTARCGFEFLGLTSTERSQINATCRQL